MTFENTMKLLLIPLFFQLYVAFTQTRIICRSRIYCSINHSNRDHHRCYRGNGDGDGAGVKRALFAYNYELLQPISDSSITTSTSCPTPPLKRGECEGKDDDSNYDDNYNIDHSDDGAFFEFPSDEDLALLPKGKKGGHRIIRQYIYHGASHCDGNVGSNGNDNGNGNGNGNQITIQAALKHLDPEKFPSLSKARKACRKGSIIIHRGPIVDNHGQGYGGGRNISAFDPSSKTSFRARVGDILYANDVIGVQIMMGTFRKKRCYPFITYTRPQFILPVLYEDDYMAIVDKPANIAMYGKRLKRSGGSSSSSNSFSRRTIRDALPYCLTPPRKGTKDPLKRPTAVHRLDTPTSGLVVVAKTKDSLSFLCQQFAERKVVKEYTAIINGDVAVDGVKDDKLTGSGTHTSNWNIVNYPLGSKYAITQWRAIRHAKSLNAKDGTLTLVQVRPLTGRYHQIRRHFAWIGRRPLVGDHLYAGHLQAPRFRRNGLYLCSNGISVRHPHYNMSNIDVSLLRTEDDFPPNDDKKNELTDNRRSYLSLEGDRVVVNASKKLPKRFAKLLDGEEIWAERNGCSVF